MIEFDRKVTPLHKKSRGLDFCPSCLDRFYFARDGSSQSCLRSLEIHLSARKVTG